MNPDTREMPAADAELVRRLNRVDQELWELANRRLDEALATLPPLPPRPLSRAPWTLTMDQPLIGRGWQQRLDVAGVGWHRWTGPETRSTVVPDVRLHGPADLEVEIIAVASDDHLRRLILDVQGRVVPHELHAGVHRFIARARVALDGSRPAEIGLTVPATRPIPLPDGSSSFPTALAVRNLRLAPVD